MTEMPTRCKECSHLIYVEDKFPNCNHKDENYIFKTRKRFGRGHTADRSVDVRRKQRPYWCPLENE